MNRCGLFIPPAVITISLLHAAPTIAMLADIVRLSLVSADFTSSWLIKIAWSRLWRRCVSDTQPTTKGRYYWPWMTPSIQDGKRFSAARLSLTMLPKPTNEIPGHKMLCPSFIENCQRRWACLPWVSFLSHGKNDSARRLGLREDTPFKLNLSKHWNAAGNFCRFSCTPLWSLR